MAIKEVEIYENKFRPNYEVRSLLTWGAVIPAVFAVQHYYQLPIGPMWVATACAGAMMLRRVPSAYNMFKFHGSLQGEELTFITMKNLQKKVKQLQKQSDKEGKKNGRKHDGYLWLGTGFEWDQPHAQLMNDLMRRNRSEIIKADPDTKGSPWIHGIGQSKEDIIFSIDSSALMVGVIGATGSGKTKFADIVVSQLVLRGECVLIIDPKLDEDLLNNTRRACELSGQADRFISFRRTHPEDSVRLDLMANFSSSSELATRITSLLDDSDFKSFAHMAINNTVAGIVMAGKKPQFKSIRHYLETDLDGLAMDAIVGYTKNLIGDEQANDLFKEFAENTASLTRYKKAQAMIMLYREKIEKIKASPDLDGVINLFERDRAHLQKLISSAFPLLTSMTSGEMGDLLSPDPHDDEDHREITSIAKMAEKNQVGYIGLASMGDPVVADTIGTMILSDFGSYAQDVYSFKPTAERKPINLIIDEASQVTSDALIQLLSKSRGAGVRIWVFSQSIADYAAKLGSKDKASVLFDNLNNLVALRTTGNESQEYITSNIPTVFVKTIMESHGTNSMSDDPLSHTGNIGERLMETEVPAFPPPLMGMIPNMEYIAKLSGGRIVKGKIPILKD